MKPNKVNSSASIFLHVLGLLEIKVGQVKSFSEYQISTTKTDFKSIPKHYKLGAAEVH